MEPQSTHSIVGSRAALSGPKPTRGRYGRPPEPPLARELTEPSRLCVRECWRHLLARDLTEPLAERGVEVAHAAVFRWLQSCAPEIEKRIRPHPHPSNGSWRVDETYVRHSARRAHLRGRKMQRRRITRLRARPIHIRVSGPAVWYQSGGASELTRRHCGAVASTGPEPDRRQPPWCGERRGGSGPCHTPARGAARNDCPTPQGPPAASDAGSRTRAGRRAR